MGDIISGLAVIGLLSVGLFVLGARIGRRLGRRAAAVLAGIAVAGIVLHAFVLLGEPRLAWLLPFSNLVVVGNWSPPLAAFLAGLVWSQPRLSRWRRALVIVPLIGVCVYRAYAPLLGEPPRCRDVWEQGVCIQTSLASCGAASTATLLHAHGIATSEREMASLCLTRDWGTSWHGMYRGLKLKTAGMPYRVEVFTWSFEELRASPARPLLLRVLLPAEDARDPRYARDWGWLPGVPHVVVLFSFCGDGLVEIGDPGVGRETWRADQLEFLYDGVGMRLVPDESWCVTGDS
jgi:hypothetical protein